MLQRILASGTPAGHLRPDGGSKGSGVSMEAVLWDIDGTLALSEPFHLRALRTTAAEDGIELPPEIHEVMLGRTAEETHAYIVEHYGLSEPFDRWIERKYGHYVRAAPTIPPRPGALEAFLALARRGVKQALVSNSDRIVVEANIKALGLFVPRLVSVSRNDVIEGKPAPECYLRAALLLGVEPSRCVVIEDSPTGAQAGVNAGMRVLAWPEQPGFTFPAGAEVVEDVGRVLLG